jgi:hypothetical protein
MDLLDKSQQKSFLASLKSFIGQQNAEQEFMKLLKSYPVLEREFINEQISMKPAEFRFDPTKSASANIRTVPTSLVTVNNQVKDLIIEVEKAFAKQNR